MFFMGTDTDTGTTIPESDTVASKSDGKFLANDYNLTYDYKQLRQRSAEISSEE